jgi:hypothetical protein
VHEDIRTVAAAVGAEELYVEVARGIARQACQEDAALPHLDRTRSDETTLEVSGVLGFHDEVSQRVERPE